MFASRLLSVLAVLDGGRLFGAVGTAMGSAGTQGVLGVLGRHGLASAHLKDAGGAMAADTPVWSAEYGREVSDVGMPIFSGNRFQRWGRDGESRHYDSDLDKKFLHLPTSALEHFPDGEQACQAMRNASMLHQILAVPVLLELPCPVTLKHVVDPTRMWPPQLVVAECACPAKSCRPRTAYVCTQLFSFVTVVTRDADGQLRHHRRLVATGCQCMTSRATMAPELDDD